MSVLTINKLTASVGAEVTGLDSDLLATDDALGRAVLDALEDNGVLVFPGLGLDPEAQVAFCRRLGAIDHSSDGHHPIAGIYPVTLDKSKNSSADYLRATFDWHIDGCTPTNDECPQKATVLSAKQVAERGGETEFANSYAAYEAFSDEEKQRFGALRVVHSLEASQRRVHPDPSPELVAKWRSRPTHEHPLVWTHRSGRKSLVLGASADYLRATFDWHIDGCTPTNGECPQKATVLSAKQVADRGGETEFANSYAAYEAFSEDEKERFGALRVMHSLEASQRRVHADPSPELLAKWRSRPTHEHPLVWTHRSGRKSLVLGASADYVVGMGLDEGRALLADLLDRATRRDLVYSHRWSVGDTVIWDNNGVLHRAAPYDRESPREMLRTTVLGDEPIQ